MKCTICKEEFDEADEFKALPTLCPKCLKVTIEVFKSITDKRKIGLPSYQGDIPKPIRDYLAIIYPEIWDVN